MVEESSRNTRFVASALRWWKETSVRKGYPRALRQFVSLLWQFARESTPSRRRQRYGDVDYDWDFRVDTTSATVGWRDRLLGLFHSPYQPTEPALFREMLATLAIDFRRFVFIDIGSGKGRVLLMAADYPLLRILGIELLPALHRMAQNNIRKYKSNSQRCFAIESAQGDARDFVFPPEPTVLYLFNPLPGAGLAQLLDNLERSLQEHPRPLYLLYHNPLLEHVLAAKPWLRQIASTLSYQVYEAELKGAGASGVGC
jgi:SAM-dependent methyltransferase